MLKEDYLHIIYRCWTFSKIMRLVYLMEKILLKKKSFWRTFLILWCNLLLCFIFEAQQPYLCNCFWIFFYINTLLYISLLFWSLFLNLILYIWLQTSCIFHHHAVTFTWILTKPISFIHFMKYKVKSNLNSPQILFIWKTKRNDLNTQNIQITP